MYTFYQSPGSSSMAVHIALHEVGAPFQTKRIGFAERDKDPPEFRRFNPEGKVPTLVIEGRPLTEVAGCLYYLAHAYPRGETVSVRRRRGLGPRHLLDVVHRLHGPSRSASG